ncbi:hypothetical protein [Alkalihalobacillus deserti]|uniref:hypothetical protein n=1 Tax=Alkalihalobacillus deserti TaxID=2879466 RepID=UPI001D153642|nr:hypothetical protein [Alkalihalobacillus deserti]
MKIISWYAHKEKGNKKEERMNLEKTPAKGIFKMKKSRKENEDEKDEGSLQ